MGGQPLGRRTMRPRKSNNRNLRTRRARGEVSLSLGTHDIASGGYGEAASASLVVLHSYPRPHVLVATIHMETVASVAAQAH